MARKLTRSQLIPFFAELPPCVVAMEACSSAHHWGRALIELGHEVTLIPRAHVKPYVRRNKNDRGDLRGDRPGQRFVPVRSIENQAALMRHRARELLAGQRTAALNALRSHLAEIGVVAPQGAQHAYGLKRMAADGFNENGEIVVPDCVRGALGPLVGQIDALDEAIGAIDSELAASVKADETAKRLMTIPGIGPVTASAKAVAAQEMCWRRRSGENRLNPPFSRRQKGGPPKTPGRISLQRPLHEQQSARLRKAEQFTQICARFRQMFEHVAKMDRVICRFVPLRKETCGRKYEAMRVLRGVSGRFFDAGRGKALDVQRA